MLLPDGSEAVGSEEVTRTFHDHFKKQFEAQCARWHEEPELDTAMRALFAYSKAGMKAREIILRGVWPLALGEMTTKASQEGAARLVSMCTIKLRANGLQHTDYLATITPDELKRCLRLKIVPYKWLVEIVCPGSKSGSPSAAQMTSGPSSYWRWPRRPY